MEVTFIEDPACSWCWAFQPSLTTFLFEFGDAVRTSRAMGGLRDLPVANVEFTISQWRRAADVSGMPFDASGWKKHRLTTTFPACRAVKAASMISAGEGQRLLRRLQEAFFLEQAAIDDLRVILDLAIEIDINPDTVTENIASGRAEGLFKLDRKLANRWGFGFPTTLVRERPTDQAIVLQGLVEYSEIVEACLAKGVPEASRRLFEDTEENWERLFSIHGRLTLPEIQAVTGMDKTRLTQRMKQLPICQDECLYRWKVASTEVGDHAVEELAAAESAESAESGATEKESGRTSEHGSNGGGDPSHSVASREDTSPRAPASDRLTAVTSQKLKPPSVN